MIATPGEIDADARVVQRLQWMYWFFSWVRVLLLVVTIVAVPAIVQQPWVTDYVEPLRWVISDDLCEALALYARALIKYALRLVDAWVLQVVSGGVEFVNEVSRVFVPPPYHCADMGMHDPLMAFVFAAEHTYPALGHWLATTNTPFYMVYALPTIKQCRAQLAHANASTLALYAQCADDLSYMYYFQLCAILWILLHILLQQ